MGNRKTILISTTSLYNLLLCKIACNIETFISLSLYFVSKMFCNSISKFARLKIVLENIWRTTFYLINTTNFLFYIYLFIQYLFNLLLLFVFQKIKHLLEVNL